MCKKLLISTDKTSCLTTLIAALVHTTGIPTTTDQHRCCSRSFTHRGDSGSHGHGAGRRSYWVGDSGLQCGSPSQGGAILAAVATMAQLANGAICTVVATGTAGAKVKCALPATVLMNRTPLWHPIPITRKFTVHRNTELRKSIPALFDAADFSTCRAVNFINVKELNRIRGGDG